MPTVDELTDPYANFMLGPSAGPDVCEVCFTFTQGYPRCYACAHMEQWCAALALRLQRDLAAILWRYLRDHESCLGAAAGVGRFDLVTTVPSSDHARDGDHPLAASPVSWSLRFESATSVCCGDARDGGRPGLQRGEVRRRAQARRRVRAADRRYVDDGR